jgi:multiple sugar transport system ATP-binding protein
VDVVEPTGPDTIVVSQLNGKRLLSRVHPSADPRPGQIATLLFDVSKAVLFDPESGTRIDAPVTTSAQRLASAG